MHFSVGNEALEVITGRCKAVMYRSGSTTKRCAKVSAKEYSSLMETLMVGSMEEGILKQERYG